MMKSIIVIKLPQEKNIALSGISVRDYRTATHFQFLCQRICHFKHFDIPSYETTDLNRIRKSNLGMAI